MSTSDSWRTPDWLFTQLDRCYGPFDLDVAADALNHRCLTWYGPGSPWATDALTTRWEGTRAFCNPPYSRGHIELFLAKAHHESDRVQTTFVLPADTSTAWWHNWVYFQGRRPYSTVEVEFLRKRVQFVRPDGSVGRNGPTFPTVVVTIAA